MMWRLMSRFKIVEKKNKVLIVTNFLFFQETKMIYIHTKPRRLFSTRCARESAQKTTSLTSETNKTDKQALANTQTKQWVWPPLLTTENKSGIISMQPPIGVEFNLLDNLWNRSTKVIKI